MFIRGSFKTKKRLGVRKINFQGVDKECIAYDLVGNSRV